MTKVSAFVTIVLVVVGTVCSTAAVSRNGSSSLLHILSRRSAESAQDMDVRAATPTAEGCHTADGRIVPLWGEVSRQGCHYEMCGPMGLLLPAHDCTLAPPVPTHVPTTAAASNTTTAAV